MRWPRRVMVCAVLAVGMLALPGPAGAETAPPHRLSAAQLDPELGALQGADAMPAGAPPVDTTTHCGAPAPEPVPDGVPIGVSIAPGPSFTVGRIPASWWRTPPYGDAGWQLQLRGFMWVNGLAQRAHDDGQKRSLRALVDQVVRFHAENPDPGSNDAGWDEGSALRRLGAENCLYSLTRDSRLVPGMQADVAVQYGWRFYGPPYKAFVHNHGVMADHAIVKAGDLLGRKDWVDASLNRLQAAAPGAWTPQGVNREQSSSYHVFNAALWGWIADTFDQHRGKGNAGSRLIRGLVTKADAVSAWLTAPDGRLDVYGDAAAEPGLRHTSYVARTFHDDVAGLAVGRWSWTDPRTSYYVIRYGPKRWGHGQQDRVGVTWSTAGVRVLVNPGRAPYDATNGYRTYAGGADSHNVARPDRGTLDTAAGAALVSLVQKRAWHTWTFADAEYGVRHGRQISVLAAAHRLVCTDTVSGRSFHQFWHLDPHWAYAGASRSGHTLWFTWGSRRLTVTTTGTGTELAGSIRPVAGWIFPTAATRMKAAQILVQATTTATTTFTVG